MYFSLNAGVGLGVEGGAMAAGHRGIFDDDVRRIRIAERHLAERTRLHQLLGGRGRKAGPTSEIAEAGAGRTEEGNRAGGGGKGEECPSDHRDDAFVLVGDARPVCRNSAGLHRGNVAFLGGRTVN